MSGHRIIRAPQGSEKSCKGWHQEAALRMLMNNLDPDVAENPDRLIVYGGTGRAARSWEAFDAIVRSLRALENDETLLVQSGKPVGVFRTHDEAPRVLIAIELLSGAEALEFRRPLRSGAGVEQAYERVRAISPAVNEDRSLSLDIERVAAAIRNGDFDSETEKI